MPIYEYKCDLCNGMWEELQKFSDDPITICKSCEKEGGVHKLLPGRMNFILHGQGWYKDGYSSKKDEGKAELVTKKVNTATGKSEIIDKVEAPRGAIGPDA